MVARNKNGPGKLRAFRREMKSTEIRQHAPREPLFAMGAQATWQLAITGRNSAVAPLHVAM